MRSFAKFYDLHRSANIDIDVQINADAGRNRDWKVHSMNEIYERRLFVIWEYCGDENLVSDARFE